jgi:hypothetical protein
MVMFGFVLVLPLLLFATTLLFALDGFVFGITVDVFGFCNTGAS